MDAPIVVGSIVSQDLYITARVEAQKVHMYRYNLALCCRPVGFQQWKPLETWQASHWYQRWHFSATVVELNSCQIQSGVESLVLFFALLITRKRCPVLITAAHLRLQCGSGFLFMPKLNPGSSYYYRQQGAPTPALPLLTPSIAITAAPKNYLQ